MAGPDPFEGREEALARAGRLADLGRLTISAGHQLQNVLTGILGYAELGLRATDPGRRARALTIIKETAERANRLVSGLVEHARPSPVSGTCPVDLAQVVHDVVKLVGTTTPVPGARILEDVAPVPPVRGARDGYAHILLDLVTNALEALGPEGGTVTVSTREEGDRVLLTVADDGIGMSPEVAARAFEPLFSAWPEEPGRTRGPGLGLGVARWLAGTMGAELTLASTPGVGTVLTLSCLAETPASAEVKELDPGAPVPAPEGSTRLEVLVVDDEPVVRTLLMDIVSHHGHLATGAVHGGEAWGLLLKRHFDVVFLDVLMPVMNGIELLARLATAEPRPRVVVMSGKLAPETEEAVLRFAVHALLPKPFSMKQVSALLDRFAEAKGREASR